jgi:hypothetical protein
MTTTPIAHLSVPTSRVLSSMPNSIVGRAMAHVNGAPNAGMYVATPAIATTTDTTTVVNPWLGGGVCGNEGTGSAHVGTSIGFAPKRFAPGRLEGMT